MLFHALVINVKKFTNLELPDEGGNFVCECHLIFHYAFLLFVVALA